MAAAVIDHLKPSAFSYDNCARNATLGKIGVKSPTAVKTGTTIVGVTFKDGVVLGADSRATAGDIIADKYCLKLHKLTDNIYACGAGTAADMDQVAKMLSSNLKLMELNTDRKARVVTTLRMARQHLFRYQGYVGAHLIIGGVDFYGPELYSCSGDGHGSKMPYLSLGSGSLAALGVLERDFKLKMSEEAATDLVIRALSAGMAADLASGNSLTYAVIKKDGAKETIGVVPDFCKSSPKDLKYRYPPNTTTVLKTKEIKYDVVEEMEVS